MGYRDFLPDKTTADFLKAANNQSYRFFAESNAKRPEYRSVAELTDDWYVVAAQDMQSMENIDYEKMASYPGVYGMNADAENRPDFFRC
jgi:hypothetical protein